jgi:hypothetical protein
MFYSALCKGNTITFIEIMKLDVMRIFCEALTNTDDVTIIDLGLSAILKTMILSRSEFHTHQNVKNELSIYNALIRIERLACHKNETISKKANQILNILDLELEESNKMDYEAN